MTTTVSSTRQMTLPSFRLCPRLISHGLVFKHSPPVRLKEFPKAENELRGVRSGLLGLLTGLHRPELNVGRKKRDTQERDGQWRQIHRSQLHTQEALLQRALACYRQQGELETAPSHGGFRAQATLSQAESLAQSKCSVEKRGISSLFTFWRWKIY